MNKATHPSAVLLTGMAMFGIALLTLGVLLALHVPVFVAALVGIALFSLTETVYTPSVNTAFAQIRTSSVLESFNAQQLLVAVGQSLGTLVGTSIFLAVADGGTGVLYWIALALAGIAVAGLATVGTRSVVLIFRPWRVRRTS
jgi:hypothetical protein